jgi:hypothetical protein
MSNRRSEISKVVLVGKKTWKTDMPPPAESTNDDYVRTVLKEIKHCKK